MAASDNRIISNRSNPAEQKNTAAQMSRSIPQRQVSSRTLAGTSGGFSKDQVVKGEIIDLRDKDIKIQLEDSRIVQAKMEDTGNLSIGDKASFQVTDSSLNSMSLKLLSKGYAASQEYMLEKALDEANLPHTEKNMTAVRELLTNQLPINKSAIQQLLKQSVLYKNASLSTLALMNKLNMPMNEVTASQFEAYRNYEHRIINQLDSYASSLLDGTLSDEAAQLLIDILSDTAMSGSAAMKDSAFMPDSLNTSDASSLNAGLGINNLTGTPDGSYTVNQAGLNNGIIHTDAEEGRHNLLPFNTILSPEECLSLTELLDSFGFDNLDPSGFISGSMPIGEAARTILGISEGLKTDEAAVKANPDSVEHEAGIFPSIINNELLNNLPEALQKPEVYTVLENYMNASIENLELSSFLPLSEREQLVWQLKSLELPDSINEQIKNGDMPADKMLTLFSRLINSSEDDASKLINNPVYKAIMKELLISRWTLTPKELTKADALNQYYERLDEDLKKLGKLELKKPEHNDSISSLNDNPAGKQSGNAANVRENIDFMKTLNQMFIYCQMPMKLSGKNVHSELYVYTNKKSLRNNKDQIKVLLHLDMEYLGPLDIHVELNGKTVSTKFYVEKKDSLPIISDNVDVLTNSIEGKGYTHNVEILKRNKEIDIVEEFIVPKDLGLDMKRYTFDRRA